jgi:acetyl esterase/lipase
MHETREENPELWDLASPITQVHPDAPPFMLVHGERDSLAVVTEGRVFSQKLREVSKNPVVYLELPGAEHAFEIVHSQRTEETIDGVHRFLEWARARHAASAATDPQSPAVEAQSQDTEEAALES